MTADTLSPFISSAREKAAIAKDAVSDKAFKAKDAVSEQLFPFVSPFNKMVSKAKE